ERRPAGGGSARRRPFPSRRLPPTLRCASTWRAVSCGDNYSCTTSASGPARRAHQDSFARRLSNPSDRGSVPYTAHRTVFNERAPVRLCAGRLLVIRPRAVPTDARVSLVAPAGPMAEGAAERAADRLRSWGWHPLLGRNTRGRRGYLSGTDD